jgi:hypothetical protein
MKINANFQAFAGVNFEPAKYIPSPSFGVNRFMLDRIGTEKARATTIVEYKPNSKFPEHKHIGGEEFLVLEVRTKMLLSKLNRFRRLDLLIPSHYSFLLLYQGTFKDQFGEFPAGTYVRNPIDSKHAPWVDGDGCTIWVKLLQMADVGEGTDPIHINFEQEKKTKGKETDYGIVMDMYRNDTTGELVQMCWINANQSLPADELSFNGGEELFILDGSLKLDGGEEYRKWGWLRFPVRNGRQNITGGSEGARVFRKTGHLTEKALRMEKIQIHEDD